MYYDEARRGLGEEFLHEVERAIACLDQYPEAAPKVGREVRRLVLARFPYSVIYRHLGAGQLRILAVAKAGSRTTIGQRKRPARERAEKLTKQHLFEAHARCAIWSCGLPRRSESQTEAGPPLLSPDEVRRLPEGDPASGKAGVPPRQIGVD